MSAFPLSQIKKRVTIDRWEKLDLYHQSIDLSPAILQMLRLLCLLAAFASWTRTTARRIRSNQRILSHADASESAYHYRPLRKLRLVSPKEAAVSLREAEIGEEDRVEFYYVESVVKSGITLKQPHYRFYFCLGTELSW